MTAPVLSVTPTGAGLAGRATRVAACGAGRRTLAPVVAPSASRANAIGSAAAQIREIRSVVVLPVCAGPEAGG